MEPLYACGLPCRFGVDPWHLGAIQSLGFPIRPAIYYRMVRHPPIAASVWNPTLFAFLPVGSCDMPVFPTWLDTLCSATLVVGALSSFTILIDVLRRPQPMAIMNFVWPICALFGIVFVPWLYFRYGRSRQKGSKHPKTRSSKATSAPPFTVSVATGTLHCGAGCALGDFVAEWLAFLSPGVAIAFGWHSLFDEKTYAIWALDFVAAFGFGIVFQYFAIAPMRHLSLRQGIIAALKADSLSLTAWQIGMYCSMAIFQFLVFGRAFGHQAPVDSVEFWAAMQVAMIGGFLTSYPMNWWLIRAGIKERM